jgi:hypothetical protein
MDDALAKELKVWLMHGKTPQWVRATLLKRGLNEERVEGILRSVFGANYREETRPERPRGRWRWLGVVVLLVGVGLNIQVWLASNGAVLTSWSSLACIVAGIAILAIPDHLSNLLQHGHRSKPRRS